MSKKIVTYDDTRDIAINVVEELIAMGFIVEEDEEGENHFEIQDTIQDKINEVLGLDIDDNFEIEIKNI